MISKKQRLALAKKEHDLKIEELVKKENEEYELLNVLIMLTNTEIKIVNSRLISLKTTREEAQDTLSCFKDVLAPIKIQNSKYTTYSDREKDSSYTDIFPITVSVNQYRVSLSYNITIDNQDVSVLHELTDAVSRVSVNEEWDKHMCGEKLYSNCKLVTAVDSKVQVYGTHANGLHQYTMWWDYDDKYGKDFEEVFNTFLNALSIV